MSSTPRRRNGFSPTTIVLILVLLGAVAGASRLVTPPPPEPPKPQPVQKIDPVAQHQKEQERMDQYKKQMAMQQAYKNSGAGKLTPVKDPNTVEITNDYFRTHKAGEAGLEEADKQFKKQSEEYKEYLKKREEAEKKNPMKAPPAMLAPSPKK